jgi:hypothetical protein
VQQFWLVALRIIALIPLAYLGMFGVFCVCFAISGMRDATAAALVFLAIGLVSTLAYPGMIDFERWFERMRPPKPAERGLLRLPLLVYDAFFLGGGLIGSWRLRSRFEPLESIGVAFVLWIIAGAVARRRVADLDAAAAKKKT